MSTFGTTFGNSTGKGVMASADGVPRWKAGGITIDWSTVGATAAQRTLADGRVVPAGSKYLRYGKVLCKITATGKYGPYNAALSNGQELLTRGNCFILNETVVDSDPVSDHPAVFDGGRVWRDRVTDVALANTTEQYANPSESALNTAFPDVTWVHSD